MVWLARATTVPSRNTASTGLETGSRDCSLTMRNTASIAQPRASASVHPVNRSATRFISRTAPVVSVVTTASPML